MLSSCWHAWWGSSQGWVLLGTFKKSIINAMELPYLFSKNRPSGRNGLNGQNGWNGRHVRLSVCPFVHFLNKPFKCFSASTSRSWMSKNFRDLDILGKSNEKKWSQIWKLLLIKGVKSLRKFVFGRILPYWTGFY